MEKAKNIFVLLSILVVLTVTSFTQAVTYQEINIFNSGGLNSLSVGDLNRDGKADVAFGLTDGRVWRAVQTGTRGAFSSNQVDSYGLPVNVKVAELNADGYNDIAVGRAGYGDLHKNVSTGADTFSYGYVDSFGSYAGPVTADLNRDGLTDIALIRASDGSIHREFQNGSGGLTYGYIAGIGGEQHAITTGHLDATTSSLVNDIVVSRWVSGYGASVYVEFQTGVGTFSETLLGNYGSVVTQLATGDLNADGKQDILTVLADGRLFRAAQTGSHTFAELNVLNYGQSLTAVKIGDLNNDGRDDIVTALADGRLFVELQLSAGVFTGQLVSTFSGTTVKDIGFGNLDGDGLNDFVVGLNDGRAFAYYQVPEPATLGLLALGAMAIWRRNRN
jgi:hypothetical protein